MGRSWVELMPTRDVSSDCVVRKGGRVRMHGMRMYLLTAQKPVTSFNGIELKVEETLVAMMRSKGPPHNSDL